MRLISEHVEPAPYFHIFQATIAVLFTIIAPLLPKQRLTHRKLLFYSD